MPDSVPLPDAAALFFPFHLAWLGLFDRRPASRRERADPRGRGRIGIGRDPARQAPRRARLRDRGQRREGRACAASSAPTWRSTTPPTTSTRSCSKPPTGAGRRRVRQRRRSGDGGVDGLHRVQRPLPDDGLRVEQGRRRRAVHRAPARRARQPQALRRAARVRTTGHGADAEDRDGLELRVERARRADQPRDRRVGRAGRGQARDRRRRRLRSVARGDGSDGESPVDGRTIVLVP